ncbi:MAG: FecR family protein, partial [Bacteroidales bacterium]|nr:FecR family protein [Bacteroidales bacterium]
MDNYYLLIKYHQNELNADEITLVENWLSESDENKKKYEQYIHVWRASQNVKVLDNLDIDSDWKLITNKASVKQLPLNRTLGYMLRIAAVLMLIFGSYWFLQEKILSPNYLMVQNESIDKLKTITLPDGTKVTLNYQANLHYPKHFRKKTRDVKLEGNAFFEVAKNKNKAFVIETDKSLVEVLGTSFDIQAKQNKTIVTVASGKVRVSNKIKERIYVELTPNEQAIHEGEKVYKHNVQVDNFLSWKTGIFRFKNHSLNEVMEILERR